VTSRGSIAHHLDLSPRQLREHMAAGVIPADADLDGARLAYIRHLRAQAGGRAGDSNLSRERAGLARAQRELTELKTQLARGDLVERADFLTALIGLWSAASQRLQAMPSRLAPELARETDPAKVAEILEREIHAALHDIADRAEAEADAAEAREAAQAVKKRTAGEEGRR